MRGHGVKTVVLEKVDLSDSCDIDLLLMEKHLKTKCERKRTKISFFSTPLKNERELKKVSNSSYLGYALIHNDLRGSEVVNFVAESVTKPLTRDSDFVHSQARQLCTVLGQEYVLKGSYFAEKDRFTSSCAHVALKIASENMSDITKKKLTYHEINELLKIDYVKKSPADGLIPKQIEKVLEYVDLFPMPFDFDKPPPQMTYQQAIYHAIESNWPAILCFSLDNDDWVIGRRAFPLPVTHTPQLVSLQ